MLLRLPAALKTGVALAASRLNVSQGEVLRRAVAAFVSKHLVAVQPGETKRQGETTNAEARNSYKRPIF